jgi:hypothetical protein
VRWRGLFEAGQREHHEIQLEESTQRNKPGGLADLGKVFEQEMFESRPKPANWAYQRIRKPFILRMLLN